MAVRSTPAANGTDPLTPRSAMRRTSAGAAMDTPVPWSPGWTSARRMLAERGRAKATQDTAFIVIVMFLIRANLLTMLANPSRPPEPLGLTGLDYAGPWGATTHLSRISQHFLVHSQESADCPVRERVSRSSCGS